MKKLFTVLVLLISLSSFAQWGGEKTEAWFDLPNKETLNSPNLIVVQHNIFIDPMGKAPNGRGGRQFGYEFTAIMGWGYIAPSISTFPQLEDGYTDVVVTLGVNWHLFKTTLIRYYAGYRLGREFRGGDGYEIMGLSLGADVKLYTFNDESSVYLGGELWVDHRESQRRGWYGISTEYDDPISFTNSMSKGNGKLKIGYRF